MRLLRYFLYRVMQMFPIALFIVISNFALIHMAPGTSRSISSSVPISASFCKAIWVCPSAPESL